MVTLNRQINPYAPLRLLVIKIGSALLVDNQNGTLRRDWLAALCRDLSDLKANGVSCVIVSSGAIALGRARLGLLDKSLSLNEKQACAAAGQSRLTQAYEAALALHDIKTAQVLFTLNDTEDRRRWLNARSTLTTLIELGTIPIINENDTVATDEIRYGDNDRLAARTAQMLGADTLILLSDIDGLYSSDPGKDGSAVHIPEITVITDDITAMAGPANVAANVGTGGMVTKLSAAHIAMRAGCSMCIMDGARPAPLTRLADGERASWFKAAANPKDARRQWISGSLKPKGQIYIDSGAARALRAGKSLLSAGVERAKGTFSKGDAVQVLDGLGTELARGLISYDNEATQKIVGLRGDEILGKLGYDNGPALIHRDNLVMMDTI